MSGTTDLDLLLREMKPYLNEGQYVFCTVKEAAITDHPSAICWFREEQGKTLVLAKEDADKLGLAYDYLAAWITLEVHSSLAAVGLTAAVSAALAQHNISCNVVAAYYHDHLFVDVARADHAMDVLRKLSQGT